MKLALDTNVITYYLKGHERTVKKIDNEAESDNIIIPPFVYFEIKKWLLANNSKTKLQAFEKLFDKFGIDIIDKEIFDISLSIYMKLREKGLIIDDGDILIAAYCIKNDYTLVTNNLKHFKNIEDIQIIDWSSICF